MDHKLIITIDREYGSGGHEVGRRLAEQLGIKFYDEELIAQAASGTGYVEEYVKENDEKAPDFSIASLLSSVDTFQSLPYAKIQEEQFSIIRNIAAKESCVIVGRAADYILDDEEHISVFIFAPIEERLKRKLELEIVNKKENPLNEAEMIKKIKHRDKQRRRYYEFYTDNKWGERDVYDLLINTSRAGIDGAVDIIRTYIDKSKGQDILSGIVK
ncbi:MAG: cytidylate kinase-like family protein [Mogibacterium sp.]|nr:cytidylate kinase-like family protein [Mogibacterium sp.]